MRVIMSVSLAERELAKRRGPTYKDTKSLCAIFSGTLSSTPFAYARVDLRKTLRVCISEVQMEKACNASEDPHALTPVPGEQEVADEITVATDAALEEEAKSSSVSSLIGTTNLRVVNEQPNHALTGQAACAGGTGVITSTANGSPGAPYSDNLAQIHARSIGGCPGDHSQTWRPHLNAMEVTYSHAAAPTSTATCTAILQEGTSQPLLPPPAYLTPPHPMAANSNNSNSLHSAVLEYQAATAGEPPRKRAKGGGGKQPTAIELSLEGKNLWDEFYRRGTEMIVNRAGRRMFPGFAVSISGLRPKAKYTMRLEVILADNHRFKFLNARWLAVGTAEPQPLSSSYTHPDSPNSGAFWMRHGVSFRKLKITNNKERPGTSALLHSMHKYFLRLHVEEEKKTPPGEERGPPKPIATVDFPETTFVAVTAYQNEEVTQLKISNNPFAKAFRENASDMDWETAQMLYGNAAMFSPISQHGEQFGGGVPTPGLWPLQSPFLPPTPLSGSLPSISPLSHLPHHHQLSQPTSSIPYLSPSQLSYEPASIPGHFFQWPQLPPSSQHRHFAQTEPQSFHPATQPPPSLPLTAASTNLPDFDAVFTHQAGPAICTASS